MSRRLDINAEGLWSLHCLTAQSRLTSLSYRRQIITGKPFTALTSTLQALKNTRMFLESFVIPLVMLTLTSITLRLTDAAFQVYSHAQISSTALTEMGHQLSLGVTLFFCSIFLSFFFLGPVC